MRVCVWEEQIMKCKIQFKICIKVMTELKKKKKKKEITLSFLTSRYWAVQGDAAR